MRKAGIVFIYLFILTYVSAQTLNDKTYEIEKRFILEEGLSQNRILSILEDDLGFMWFGTIDGLNRYDGYSTRIYRNDYTDSTSLPNNTINAMVEDEKGNLWLGTSNGIACLNPNTNQSVNYISNDSNAIALGANIITSCAIDNEQNLWFGTAGYGIIKLNSRTYQKEIMYYDPNDKYGLNTINNLYIDSHNRLWIGSFVTGKIHYIDIEDNELKSIDLSSMIYTEKGVTKAASYYEDNEGRIWLSVMNYKGQDGGLFFLNTVDSIFRSYNTIIDHNNLMAYSDCYNTIQSITGDTTGNILFGSILGGIFRFRFGETPKAYYLKAPVIDSRILSLYLSSNGILWIGTNGSGVEISITSNTNFNLVNNKTTDNFSIESIRVIIEDENEYWIGGYYGLARMSKDLKHAETVNGASLYCIAATNHYPEHIWVGAEGGGLRQFNKVKNKYEDPVLNYLDKSPKFIDVFVIYPITDSLILLGTELGIYGLNPNTLTVKKYSYLTIEESFSLNGIPVRTIYKDNNGNILVGYTRGGIGKVDLKSESVIDFDQFPDFSDFNSYNPINCIHHGKDGKYWLATSSGLLELSDNKDTFILITENNGLPNNHIYSILPDNDNNLWLSTNNGISCFTPGSSIFRNYDISDGLQSNEFNTGAYLKSSNGDLFFGGIHGFNYFNPEHIKQNSIEPKLVITDVKMTNKQVLLSKDDIENQLLKVPSEVEVFTIEFAGLSFINSAKNTYEYRVKEIDNEWINLNHQNEITFYGLAPGTYHLEILASNNHGLRINTPFVYTIIVQPKYYESSLFRWLMTLLLVILIFIGIKLRLRRITAQKNKLQRLVKEQTSKLTEINSNLSKEIDRHNITAKELVKTIKTKDQFLSIIAHDIMGPLGVIQGFSDLLNKNKNDFSEQEQLNFIITINSTVKELSALLSNLLQWSRIQNKTINPQPLSINLYSEVNETVSLLLGNISHKSISFFNNVDETQVVYADSNMLQTICRNLLSNAIKFTPELGRISINSVAKDNYCEISVSDTGVGISKDDLDKLFDNEVYYTTKGTNNESGTGLGLNLVNEFVILLGGKLWIRSEIKRGTVVHFTLPMKKHDS